MKNRPKQDFSEKQETETTVERNVWDETQPVNYKTADLSSKQSLVLLDPSVKTQTNIEELDTTINSMMEIRRQGRFACRVRGKVEPKNRIHMKNHIEGSHIEGVSHPCNQCGKLFRSRNSLNKHISVYHKSF